MDEGQFDAGSQFRNTTAGTALEESSTGIQSSQENIETVSISHSGVHGGVPNPSSMQDPSKNSRLPPLSTPFPPYRPQNPPLMSSNYHASSSTHAPPRYGPYPPYNHHFVMPPLSMDHSGPPQFTHRSTYPHQPRQETGPMSSSILSSYPPVLHPPLPVYPLPHRPPEGTTNFNGTTPGSPLYHQYYTHTNHYPPSPHPNTALSFATPQGSVNSSMYPRTGHFPSPNYSPCTNSQYVYHMQPYPSSPPMYPAPYPPPLESNFGQMPEGERQTGWWYPSPTVSIPPQYKSSPAPYIGHYPGPSVVFRPMEPSYSSGPSPPNSHPLSPLRPLSQPSPTHSSLSPSPRIHGHSLSASPHPAPASPKEKPITRRSYHPNPPSHRSEWVMWVGNVPLNATHDELWRFFNADDAGPTGVLSIFLISRSNCAFVNYASEQHLKDAIARFNGKELRTTDARCPKLVCRVRKKEDDLKAGVGGQRGSGIHTKWVKEQKGKGLLPSKGVAGGVMAPPSGAGDQIVSKMEALSMTKDSNPHQRHQNRQSNSFDSGSGSFASTNSSILGRYFPKRYFILKSLTQFDLDLSVEKGLWATQKHNEGILDQAYRTSQDVYLIFSVNKSGEFYGYARMAGPIRRGEHSVSWASRTTDSQPSIGSIDGALSPSSNDDSRLKAPSKNFFTPGSNRLVEESPMEIQSADRKHAILPVSTPAAAAVPQNQEPQSAPAEFGAATRGYSLPTPTMQYSLNMCPKIARVPSAVCASTSSGEDFELDPVAPIRAIRSPGAREAAAENRTPNGSGPASMLQSVAEEEERGEEDLAIRGTQREDEVVQETSDQPREEAWGESFKIEWLEREKLPFNRTRHIRNPWNHDREIKVSRDGTELEPLVGQKLLDEWAKPKEPEASGKVNGPSEKGPGHLPSTTLGVAQG